MGEALFHLELYEDSAQAYEVAYTLAPKMRKAKDKLLEIYGQFITNEKRVNELKTEPKAKELPLRIIISGLPRSGTSLMMQIAEAGGILPFTDGKRKADESNPKGYYEHEAVKTINV